MYTEENRTELLGQIVTVISNNSVFEGLIQIGSGVHGFADMYSDIDLMAGCVNKESLETARNILHHFFNSSGAVYVDNRQWSETVLGMSAYYDNGLSVDISFMPTLEIPIKGRDWKILYASSRGFENALIEKTTQLIDSRAMIDNDFHHRFFYAIRKAQIALLRGNFVYADIALGEARQLLLLTEVIAEGKKARQFKAYHTLDRGFLELLEKTYPQERNCSEIKKAMQCLVQAYEDTVTVNQLCSIAPSQEKIINCFSGEIDG